LFTDLLPKLQAMKNSELSASLSSLRVADLKEELKERSLPTAGRKAELVARLEEYLKSQEGSSDGAEDGSEPAAMVIVKPRIFITVH
jgi:hypothetical protein